ncbi:toxin-activating lysine-acyltransferase [Aurantiacibacter sp. MUD61]|uniref:toxin-activating lysine-acyltransferase n=1 Tax=Aurantiacibacter sp. MUD61 TaxID=3009083 RepID=UPI003FA42B77
MPLFILESIAMPALLKEQLWIFRDGDQPVGAAFWAYCNEEARAKLEQGVFAKDQVFTMEDWQSGDEIWLVDLVAPFATPENNHVKIMIADLAAGPLRGKAFNFHQTDPATGKKTVVNVPAEMGDKLAAERNAS